MARSKAAALTGWGQAEDGRRTEEARFDDHLTKLTDPKQLEQLLARYASSREP